MPDFQDSLNPRLLSKTLAHFARPNGTDLLQRIEGFYEWQEQRRQAGVWPYSRSFDTAALTDGTLRTDNGVPAPGINFATQDYLSLASHPAITEAATSALREYGPHSAGSACLTGNTRLSLSLEEALADFLQVEHIALFPTGWAAGYGVIRALVRPNDYIVMDALSHNCLQEGAEAATKNILRNDHLSIESTRARLAEIRRRDTENAILVVTEGLFSMDSDTPDIRALQELCHEFKATLLVDVAHDLGALGPGGTGFIGQQNMLGQVDLVMGSFSKTFASNGGFMATRSAAVKQYVKCYGGSHTFSAALSPMQTAVVATTLGIVRSDEGEKRRQQLMRNVLALRSALTERGNQCIGDPSAVVPVPVGSRKVGWLVSQLIFARNLFANLVEFPAVALNGTRFRMQVMANHTSEQIIEAATIMSDSLDEARQFLSSVTPGEPAVTTK